MAWPRVVWQISTDSLQENSASNFRIKSICVCWYGESIVLQDLDIYTYIYVCVCVCVCAGIFKMIVGVLTTCHTQYTWDRRICVFFLFNGTTLQVFVTYLTGALYVQPLCFYKHQHDNRVRSACQRWWFQWRFWFVPSFRDTCWKRRNINLILDVTP